MKLTKKIYSRESKDESKSFYRENQNKKQKPKPCYLL